MGKQGLTEQEIRTRYITPAIREAGWEARSIRGEHYFTAGRMHIQPHGKAQRGRRNFVDYLLIYENIPIAVAEAKDNHHSIGSGMQQALRYAQAMDVPFVYSSNGDVFDITFPDVPERKDALVPGRYELPAPEAQTTVAVKIIDMLGEEVLVVGEV